MKPALRRTSVFLGMAFIFFMTQTAYASDVKLRPLNPNFISNREAETDSKFSSPVDWSFLHGGEVRKDWFQTLNSASRTGTQNALPASYDLSTMNRVPPVRDQRSWGTCWAFSGIEAIESSLLSETGVLHDLSELHLAYFTYSFEDENKPGFTRDIKEIDPKKQNGIFDNGGLFEQVMAMLSRGTGPVFESDAPYPEWLDDADDLTWANYIPPAPYAPTRFRLKGAYVFHNADEVKRALMNIGGLSFAFASFGGRYLNNGSAFYNSDDNLEPDHAVLLVGWDDNYPRTNFLSSEDKVPLRDGAWKIQNSWGDVGSENGYFWISYEDTSIFKDEWIESGAAAYVMEPLETYDGIYFHDPLVVSGVITLENHPEVRMSNAFVSKRNETVVSVGFFTGNLNIGYEIQIYRNIPEGMGPEGGKAALAAPQKGRTGPKGYYSIALDNPVPIDKGERFAVEIKLIADNESYPADQAHATVEMMVYATTDNASVAPEESYLYLGGEWEDTYNILLDASDFDNYSERNFNFNVKAFTKPRESRSGGSSGGCDGGMFTLLSLGVVALLGCVKSKK